MSATIDKIRKLLNLAQNEGANENEADTARRLAERLMAAAGLSEADVGANPDEDPLATFGASPMPKASGRAGWEDFLAVAVQSITGCYVHQSKDGGLTWVGTMQQRETAIELHMWLVAQVNRLTDGARKIAAHHPAGSRAYLGAYRRGLASSIASQAMTLRKAQTSAAPAPDTKALARRSALQQAVAKYEREHKLRARSTSYKTRAGSAYHAGVNDGRSVRLQHDVGGSTTKRLGAGK
jgi:hypothetical protein